MFRGTSAQKRDITTNMSTCNQQVHNPLVSGQYARCLDWKHCAEPFSESARQIREWGQAEGTDLVTRILVEQGIMPRARCL